MPVKCSTKMLYITTTFTKEATEMERQHFRITILLLLLLLLILIILLLLLILLQFKNFFYYHYYYCYHYYLKPGGTLTQTIKRRYCMFCLTGNVFKVVQSGDVKKYQ